MNRARLSAVALAFPSVLRTNDHWRERTPQVVEAAEQHTLARLWSAETRGTPTAFDRAMQPYGSDPFRGAVERRVRAPGEPALAMEKKAVERLLAARGLSAADVDLVLVSSFVGDRLGVGNAAYLAAALDLTAPAINYETACSGSVVGVQLAAALVRSGSYRRVLLVVSTSNSVQVPEANSLGWFIGDGCGALLMEAGGDDGVGYLGGHTINSVRTNDMFVITSVPDGGGTRLCTRPHPDAGRIARESAEDYLHPVVEGALVDAALSKDDIDFWVFNTPNAWYADFCGQALNVPEDRYHSIYPRYANIGAALMPATLYHALEEGRVGEGDVVAMYSIGSTSTAACSVLRLDRVALGSPPCRPEERDGAVAPPPRP